MKKESPSMDAWLKEAKAHESAPKIGMYLTHNGTVRQTAKAKVRYGAEDTREVTGMIFSYDEEKVNAVIADTYKMEGIYYIKVWLNEGELTMGDDIMYVLIGGDIRPRVVDALQYLVGRVKNECVVETELNCSGSLGKVRGSPRPPLRRSADRLRRRGICHEAAAYRLFR